MHFPQPQKPRSGRRRTPEANLQITVARTLRMVLIPPAQFWFCPNGGNLSDAQAGLFKEMGLLSGVSDLHFIWREPVDLTHIKVLEGHTVLGHPKYGVIEMKRPGVGEGGLSQNQKDFKACVMANGHHWAWANSLEMVLETLKLWKVPMRHVDVLPSGVIRTVKNSA